MNGKFYRNEHISNFSVYSNDILFDNSLTETAKCLMFVILSLADNWNFSKEGLRAKCQMGRTAFNNALSNLEKYGYVKITKERGKNGEFAYSWEIHETPQANEQDVIKTNTEKTSADSEPLINTNQQNTNKTNTNISNINQSITSDTIERNFKEQIEFEVLEKRFEDKPHGEKKILQNLVDLAVEVLQSNSVSFRIGREEKPKAVVESRLKKLTCEDIEHIVENIFNYANPIADPSAFMLTALYKASFTTEAQSNAKANSEFKNDFSVE
jgi:predicted transcriptional regulator